MTSCSLPLRRPDQRRILRFARKTRNADARVRCLALLKVSQGLSCYAAARELGCVPSTAWRIVHRFLTEGETALLDKRAENGAVKVDEDIRAGLETILCNCPEDYGFPRTTWTLELIALVIEQALRVRISVGHTWKILRAMGVRWGCPRPVVGCPWKAALRERRLAYLRRLARRPGPRAVVVFADEVDIHLNPRIGRDWMLKGHRRHVLTPGQNRKHYIAGAYDPLRQRLVYVTGDRKASWLFLNLLRALCAAYSWATRIHVILDNYVIHKSVVVQTALRNLPKISLQFLPPYCPNDNKIERIWLDLHANATRNHRCPTLVALMANVHRYLAGRFHVFRGPSVALAHT